MGLEDYNIGILIHKRLQMEQANDFVIDEKSAVQGDYDTHTIMFCWKQDIENIKKVLTEAKVKWFQLFEAPFYNIWGQEIGKQYGYNYIHDKKLSIAVLC